MMRHVKETNQCPLFTIRYNLGGNFHSLINGECLVLCFLQIAPWWAGVREEIKATVIVCLKDFCGFTKRIRQVNRKVYVT